MSYHGRNNDGWASAIAGLIIIGLLIGYIILVLNSRHDVTITVSDKERGSDSKPTLVFDDEHDETYKVGDSWLALHFSSSDTYRKLKRGESYECEVQGFRIPFFSSYKNIIDCEF